MYVIMPAVMSPVSSPSLVRIQVPLEPEPTTETLYNPFSDPVDCPVTNILSPSANDAPSSVAGAPPDKVTLDADSNLTLCL